jgi:hypothetical protein
MRKPIMALLAGVCLCFVALAPTLRGSTSIGVAIQSSNYDAARGITTVRIINTSHKDISALDFSYQVTFPDGTVSRAGGSFLGLDFLEGIVQGKGGFAPGTALDQEFNGQPGPVQATVDMVIYADGTADVVNEQAFKMFIADRKARVRALQRVNELLQIALMDPAIQHPSATVVAQLKSLVTAAQQQENSDGGAGAYASELQNSIQNMTNLMRSPRIADRAFESNQLGALMRTHQEHISAMLPHTELVKAVQQ